MPMMDNLVSSLTGQAPEKSVMATGLNGKAREDFCFLVRQSAMSATMNKEHILVAGPIKLPKTDVAVLGADEKTKTVTVPEDQMTFGENGRIAVVLYNGGAVKGVYVFTVEEATAGKLFSRFKLNKKTGELTISIKGIETCENNKFGMMYQDYIVKGV